MRKVFWALFLVARVAVSAFAQKGESVTLHIGQQKTAAHSRITVKFISVVEDSRCPVGVNCIWAGNARIKITVAKGKKVAKTFELNSSIAPQSISFEGYELKLLDLTAHPTQATNNIPPPASATISTRKILTH